MSQTNSTSAIVHPLLSAISLRRGIVFLSTSDESTAKGAAPSYFFISACQMRPGDHSDAGCAAVGYHITFFFAVEEGIVVLH